MKVSIIAAILIGSMLPSTAAEPTVEELGQRVARLEKTVEELAKALAFLAGKPVMKVVVPSKPDDVAAAKPEAIIINLRANGGIFVAGKELTLDELKEMLKELSEGGKDQPIRLRGDAATKYQRIVEVIDACRKADL